MKKICICAIHTDAGKTHVSAIICAAFAYEYFKLVQAGIPTDSDFIRNFNKNLTADNKIFVHKEALVLKTPTSPNVAMENEGIDICGLNLNLPKSNKLLIELAGGLFTPLDKQNFMIDFVKKHNLPLILVIKDYLGAINHTALSIEAIKMHNINLVAVVCSGNIQKLVFSFLQNKYKDVQFLHLLDFRENISTIIEDFKNQVKNLEIDL